MVLTLIMDPNRGIGPRLLFYQNSVLPLNQSGMLVEATGFKPVNHAVQTRCCLVEPRSHLFYYIIVSGFVNTLPVFDIARMGTVGLLTEPFSVVVDLLPPLELDLTPGTD